MALLRHADTLEGTDRLAGIKAARGWFKKANEADNAAPLPLVGYYQADRMRGGRISPGVVGVLESAHALVPQDDGVRMMLVQHYAGERRYADAIRVLGPLAFSPHASSEAKVALELYEELKKKRTEAVETSAR